jgi:hypothetical protein
MDILILLARKPLFRLIAAIIVLLITDYRPVLGLFACLIWVAWILMPYSHKKFSATFRDGQTQDSH